MLNTAMFVPIGIGLALLGVRPQIAIPSMCALSLGIETAQGTIIAGRDPSLSDLLTNSTGGAIGFAVGYIFDWWAAPTARRASLLVLGWMGVWIAVQTGSAISLTPAATDGQYYGQIRRALGMPRWTGEVLDASLDGARLPNTKFADSKSVRDMLNGKDGAEWQATVVPHDWIARRTSFARIADGDMHEIGMLGQQYGNFVFGVRNYGLSLRMRPLYFALRNTFPAPERLQSATDTLQLRARYTRKEVVLASDIRGVHNESHIPVTTSLAWRFLLPRQFYADGSLRDDALNALWIAAWLFPGGFWLAFAMADSRRRFVFASLVLGATGFALAPLVFGLSAPSIAEIAGGLAGMTAGFVIARVLATAQRQQR